METPRPKDEFVGDQCLVLPRNFLQSANAASELYEEELTRVARNLDVDGLRPSLAQLIGRRTLWTTLVWLVPAYWAVCV